MDFRTKASVLHNLMKALEVRLYPDGQVPQLSDQAEMFFIESGW